MTRTILGAILYNIIVFHVLMAPEGLGFASVFVVLWAFLVWQYRDRFAGLLKP